MFIKLAYLLFILDNIIREVLRFRSPNKFQATRSDKYSTNLTTLFLIAVFLLPLLMPHMLGRMDGILVKDSGIILLLTGIIIRIYSGRTLGAFYTGTLKVLERHKLITKGIYSYVRHPGYLAVLFVSIGLGLTVGNVLALISIIVLYMGIYLYRISVEEQMLIKTFGNQYLSYMKQTAHLIPFIY